MITSEKVRENRIRRVLKRQGYRLVKSRRRDPQALDYGDYMIVDERKCCILGKDPWSFSATLDEVEEWANPTSEED